jgi:hypothetical protein
MKELLDIFGISEPGSSPGPQSRNRAERGLQSAARFDRRLNARIWQVVAREGHGGINSALHNSLRQQGALAAFPAACVADFSKIGRAVVARPHNLACSTRVGGTASSVTRLTAPRLEKMPSRVYERGHPKR